MFVTKLCVLSYAECFQSSRAIQFLALSFEPNSPEPDNDAILGIKAPSRICQISLPGLSSKGCLGSDYRRAAVLLRVRHSSIGISLLQRAE